MKKVICSILFLILSASVLFPQSFFSFSNRSDNYKITVDQNVITSELGESKKDTDTNCTNNLRPGIGFLLGSHSSNLNQTSSSLDKGLVFEVYLSFDLSDEVHPILAFNYWRSKTKEINTPIVKIPSEIIESRALKLGIDFSLFKVYGVSFVLEPSIAFENINTEASAIYSLGVNFKLYVPLWNDKIKLLPSVNYQVGGEAFTFVNYLAGIEINLWH